MRTDGYSSTPLIKKLGIKDGYSVYLEHPPEHLYTLISGLSSIELDTSLEPESKDYIQIFVQYFQDLEILIAKLKPVLMKSGMLWVSWPKGKSKMDTDLNRDLIRNYILDCNLVDIKICSIDQDWSALKFVYRLKDR